MITDGRPNPGPQTTGVYGAVQYAANQGIKIYAIPITRNYNVQTLIELATPQKQQVQIRNCLLPQNMLLYCAKLEYHLAT